MEIFVPSFDFFALENMVFLLAMICVLPLLIAGIAGFFLLRRINDFTDVDVAKMQKEFDELQKKHPNASRERITRQVINRQALKCGVVGAITSVGGFWTMPITLPADILISMQIQSQMVEFIAVAFGQTNSNAIEDRIRAYLITTGGIRASEGASRVAMKFFLRLTGKGFAKLIPVVGAIIGFVVNYAIALAMGNLALSWYANKDKIGEKILKQSSTRPKLPSET